MRSNTGWIVLANEIRWPSNTNRTERRRIQVISDPLPAFQTARASESVTMSTNAAPRASITGKACCCTCAPKPPWVKSGPITRGPAMVIIFDPITLPIAMSGSPFTVQSPCHVKLGHHVSIKRVYRSSRYALYSRIGSWTVCSVCPAPSSGSVRVSACRPTSLARSNVCTRRGEVNSPSEATRYTSRKVCRIDLEPLVLG